MKLKKIILISIVLLAIVSIGAISAADNATLSDSALESMMVIPTQLQLKMPQIIQSHRMMKTRMFSHLVRISQSSFTTIIMNTARQISSVF